MNKCVKKILETLTEQPTWETDNEAKKLLINLVKSGEFNPRYSVNYVKENKLRTRDAVTLRVSSIGEHYDETVKCGEIVRELKYTVFALEHEDYYTWVNFFVCVGVNNKDYILGDFEGIVYFSSKKFYNNFTKENEIEVWDYMDI